MSSNTPTLMPTNESSSGGLLDLTGRRIIPPHSYSLPVTHHDPG